MNDEKVILKVELLKYNRINIKISITDFFFFLDRTNLESSDSCDVK